MRDRWILVASVGAVVALALLLMALVRYYPITEKDRHMADSGCKVTVAAQPVAPNAPTITNFTAAVWDNAAAPFYFAAATPQFVTCTNAGKYHVDLAFSWPLIPTDAVLSAYILVNGVQVLPATVFVPGGKAAYSATIGGAFDVPAGGTVSAQLVYQTTVMPLPPPVNVAVALSVIPGP